VLDAMLAGRFIEQRRTLLAVTVERANGGREETLALNDVVVNRARSAA
jgi:NAD kinase